MLELPERYRVYLETLSGAVLLGWPWLVPSRIL